MHSYKKETRSCQKYFYYYSASSKKSKELQVELPEALFICIIQVSFNYTGVLHNNIIPANLNFEKIDFSQSYDIPNLLRVYSFNPTGYLGLTNVKYISVKPFPFSQVKAIIIRSTKLSTVNGTGNVDSNSSNSTSAKFEVVVLSAHFLFELYIDVDAIRADYYKNLYVLQNKEKFWYTKAAFQMNNSSLLYQFSENVVFRIVMG